MTKQEILKKAKKILVEKKYEEVRKRKECLDEARHLYTCRAAGICPECGEDVNSVKGTQKKEGRVVLMEIICKSCNCVAYQEYISMDKEE